MGSGSKFCVIMVVRNEANFISYAIESVLCRDDAIIYIVDDNSTDATYCIIQELCGKYPGRIFSSKNNSEGKVSAYRNITDLPKSDFYMFLDGDDFYSEDWLNFNPALEKFTLYFHDLILFWYPDKTRIMFNPKVDQIQKIALIRNLVLLPKACWIVPEALIYHFLNIPEGVEFEDFWFSLISYKLDRPIEHLKERWYLYRQHESQVFGSQSTKGYQIVNFRFRRIIKSLEAVVNDDKNLSFIVTKLLVRYRILASGNQRSILMNLGFKAYIGYILSVYFPGFLMVLKSKIRERK